MGAARARVSQDDLSRSEWTTYACRCGTAYAATVWRWIDVEAQAERYAAARRSGPVQGSCPQCSAPASAAPGWISIRASDASAVLILDGSRRASVADELIEHLQRIKASGVAAAAWLLQPRVEFVDPLEETLPDPAARFSTPFAERDGVANTDGVPQIRFDSKSREPGIPTRIGRDAVPRPGVRVVPHNLGAMVASMTADGGLVRIVVQIEDSALEKWENAKIEVRPVHLRGHGYPLVGVRVVGKHFGQLGCIDAVVDPGHPVAADAFGVLAERFAVEVCLIAPSRTVTRSVAGEGLEPNAALCIEAARAQLASGEFLPADLEAAEASLSATGVIERLKTRTETISAGAYQHVVGGAEATRALKHLDRVSQKESLACLLEVDGLPMGEYDALRRRVLQAALQHGLCAPRRFWRRLVASGLARDLSDYVTQLARNRAAHEAEEGDLPAEDAVRAWQEIVELCRHKGLAVPAEVSAALGLEAVPPAPPDPRDRPAAAAGEIQAADAGGGPRRAGPPPARVPIPPFPGDPLRDPTQRLRAATDILQGHTPGNVEVVLAALAEFDTDELLAIMPDLSDLGPRAVPGLIALLGSDRREVRQAAVIVLGMSMEPSALDPLSNQLVVEPTTAWLDVARGLGGFGPSAIRALCQILRREAATPRESLAIDRVSRALAEIALSDAEGSRHGLRRAVATAQRASGAGAVEALADADDPRVSTAARRALASLKDVQAFGAQIRGEIPLVEATDVRGFSRRAYEAIMVPELEVEAEA